jgi:hypothetical protein
MNSNTEQHFKEQDEQVNEITKIAKRLHKNAELMNDSIEDQKV